MIEALLTVIELPLTPATDMIDIYGGSLPPSARFQVMDKLPFSTEIETEEE